MLGASRGSLARQSEALESRLGTSGIAGLGADLLSVAGMLDTQKQLRNALADSGNSVAGRQALVRQILDGRVGELAVDVLSDVVAERWSNDQDLLLSIEQLAFQAAFAGAAADGTLDATEEELFLFGRALDASSELQMALTDSAQSAEVKAHIVRDLIGSRTSATTTQVLEYAVGHLHGRRIDAVVDILCELAATQRQKLVAEVRVAAPLTDDQKQRLTAALSALKGRPVRLNVAVDPSVLGGAHVKVGDEVIDGTVASRLEQARRAILG
jgi:F-type H+-transporting ATPase subunit delta